MLKIVYKNKINERIYNHIVGPIARALRVRERYNAQYTSKDIIEVLLFSSLGNQFVESSVKQLSSFGSIVPSSDVVFRRMTLLNWSDILSRMRIFNKRLTHSWFSRHELESPIYLAIDFHDVPRYLRKVRNWRPRIKSCDDIDRVVGTKSTNGTHYAHRIASLDIVEDENFTLDFRPMFKDTNPDETIIDLISQWSEEIKIKAVLMDRGFFRGSLIDSLNKRHIPYLIRSMKTPTVERIIQNMKKEKLPFYIFDYALNKNTHKKDRRHPTIRTTTTLVVVDNATLEDMSPEKYTDDERYFAFVTNIKVNAIDTVFTLARDFRKRWRIETGYRVKKDFLGKTCSLSYSFRLLLILLSFVLGNVWTLINIKFKNNKEFRMMFNNHLPTHLMKFLFWIVFLVLSNQSKS